MGSNIEVISILFLILFFASRNKFLPNNEESETQSLQNGSIVIELNDQCVVQKDKKCGYIIEVLMQDDFFI